MKVAIFKSRFSQLRAYLCNFSQFKLIKNVTFGSFWGEYPKVFTLGLTPYILVNTSPPEKCGLSQFPKVKANYNQSICPFRLPDLPHRT